MKGEFVKVLRSIKDNAVSVADLLSSSVTRAWVNGAEMKISLFKMH